MTRLCDLTGTSNNKDKEDIQSRKWEVCHCFALADSATLDNNKRTMMMTTTTTTTATIHDLQGLCQFLRRRVGISAPFHELGIYSRNLTLNLPENMAIFLYMYWLTKRIK